MYLSPIDLLDISFEELLNIDEKKIIRLEKRLKILKLQQHETFYNQEQAYLLLDQLRDPEKRKGIIFIEKHTLFKEFITSGKDSGPKTFFFEEDSIDNNTTLSLFLAPYLESFFFPLVKKDYQKRKYDTIIEALKKRYLFTDAILLKCYTYIKQQTEILIEIIKTTPAKQLYEDQPQVTYTTHTQLLNSVPVGILQSTKIDYVNALVEYYNQSRINNTEYNKIKKAYQLFSNLTVDNPYIEKQLQELSGLGYKNNGYNESESDDTSAVAVFKIIAFIIIVIIAVVRYASKQNSSTKKFDTSNLYYNLSNIERDKKQLSQNQFLKKLYNIASKPNEPIFDKKLLPLKTGEVPFKQFNATPFYFNGQFSPKRRDSITIENSSDKSLILFTKYKGDKFKKTIFINKKDSLNIAYEKNCELIFYMGKNFAETSSLNGSASYFINVSDTDKEYLLHKYVLLDASSTSKKITVTNDRINFNTLKITSFKNRQVIQVKEAPLKTNYAILNSSNFSKEWKKNKDSFFRNLKTRARNTEKIDYTPLNGENPYPKNFKYHKHPTISGYPVLVKNNTEKHLIVFNRNLPSDRDFACYIKPNYEITLYVHEEGDSLYFNKGEFFYLFNKKKTLKMTPTDRTTFSKPYIIKGFLNGTPTITVNERTIELSQLIY